MIDYDMYLEDDSDSSSYYLYESINNNNKPKNQNKFVLFIKASKSKFIALLEKTAIKKKLSNITDGNKLVDTKYKPEVQALAKRTITKLSKAKSKSEIDKIMDDYRTKRYELTHDIHSRIKRVVKILVLCELVKLAIDNYHANLETMQKIVDENENTIKENNAYNEARYYARKKMARVIYDNGRDTSEVIREAAKHLNK